MFSLMSNLINDMKILKEILYLLKDNNRMLKEIIKYINYINAHSDDENTYDFMRNVIANVVSNPIMGRFK